MPAFSRVTTTALISVMAPASAFFLYNKQSLLTVARCQEDEQIVIVKLGGSAITEKSVFETVKKDKIDVTCSQIATASRLGKRHVIVHGAGSFGHFQARTFGLRDGGDESTWQTGVCQTRSSVLSLSGLVIKSMLDASLPATAVTLFPTSSSHQGNIFSVGSLASIETLLSLGFMPVLHGDVLLDSSKKCSVFSGDKIMLWICKHFHGSLKPKLAVFLTDVPGVYDKPPSEPDAQLIKEILVDVDGSVSSIYVALLFFFTFFNVLFNVRFRFLKLLLLNTMLREEYLVSFNVLLLWQDAVYLLLLLKLVLAMQKLLSLDRFLK